MVLFVKTMNKFSVVATFSKWQNIWGGKNNLEHHRMSAESFVTMVTKYYGRIFWVRCYIFSFDPVTAAATLKSLPLFIGQKPPLYANFSS